MRKDLSAPYKAGRPCPWPVGQECASEFRRSGPHYLPVGLRHLLGTTLHRCTDTTHLDQKHDLPSEHRADQQRTASIHPSIHPSQPHSSAVCHQTSAISAEPNTEDLPLCCTHMEHESFLAADHAGCPNASHHILVKHHIRHILGKFCFPLPSIYIHVLCHNIHSHSKQITTNQKKNDPAGNSDSILHPLRISHSFVSITPRSDISCREDLPTPCNRGP